MGMKIPKMGRQKMNREWWEYVDDDDPWIQQQMECEREERQLDDERELCNNAVAELKRNEDGHE